MTNPIHIMRAGLGDVPVLADLIRDAYRDVAQRFNLTPENCPKHPSNCTPKWIRKDLARGVSYFILEHKQEPVGCAALEKATTDLGYLERLAVLPGHRRRGFGRMLVDYIFGRGKDAGLKQIGIGIIAEQTDLLWWYRKIGFVEGDTKEFKHLPFLVTFMMYQLPGNSPDLNPV